MRAGEQGAGEQGAGEKDAGIPQQPLGFIGNNIYSCSIFYIHFERQVPQEIMRPTFQ